MVKIWNHCTQVAKTLLALGLALSHGQVLVKEDNGRNVVHVLFQTTLWSTPTIQYSTELGDFRNPSVANMTPSTVGGEYDVANGWFQYELPATALEFVFKDPTGLAMDDNHQQRYRVHKSGTYAVVTQLRANNDNCGENSTISDKSLSQKSLSDQPYVQNGGYAVTSIQETKDRLVLDLVLNPSDAAAAKLYGPDIQTLQVDVTKSSSDSIRVKITDKTKKRWQVPTQLYAKGLLGQETTHGNLFGNDANLKFAYTKNPFTFTITRLSDGVVLFDSSQLSLAFKDQYLQIATVIDDRLSIYGLGESTRARMKVHKGDKHTLWAKDQAAHEPNKNLYGSHPFFLGLHEQGSAHGVLLLNSNGMDITYDPSGLLVYQTIGGVLDFHILHGPTPRDVVSQYTALIGRPKLMPYWSYGFHQSRWGYTSTHHMREVVDKYAQHKLPLDVIWADIDYMNKFYDFTVDPDQFAPHDMQQLLSDLHAHGQKMVPIVDPGIPDNAHDPAYARGLEMNVFLTEQTSNAPYLAQVWPGPTVFPDFFHPNASQYWTEQLQRMYQLFPYDGLWIDMNEVANFCPGTLCHRKQDDSICPMTGSIAKITTCCLACLDANTHWNQWDNPPFAINNGNAREPLNHKTISTSAMQYNQRRQYDTHNLYGLTESIVTNTAQEEITNKRSFVLSRSTFPGAGAHVAHWTGDNAATWNDLQWSIPQILNFGLYGIPMVGADICGFALAPNEELCARWTALGAFYPFARNHNILEVAPQETYTWESVAHVGRKFLGLRYQLLAVYYTLGYEAFRTGLPIARPLFLTFPNDPTTHTSPAVDHQFMIGDSLLIVPILEPGTTSLSGYLPAGTWFDLVTYRRMDSTGAFAKWENLTLSDMPVLVRGGSILPLHQPGALTSAEARQSPYHLLIALSSSAEAHGQLYLDDDQDIHGHQKATVVVFTVQHQTLTIETMENNYDGAKDQTVSKVTVLGQTMAPTTVVMDGKPVETFTYDLMMQRLEVHLNHNLTDAVTITWK